MPRFLLLGVVAFWAACGSGGGFPDARPIDVAPPLGTFSLAWTVTDTNSVAIRCDQVGGQAVTVIVHNRDVDGANTQVFGCSSLTGTSQGIAPGTYDMDFELDGVAVTLGTAPSQHGIVIASEQNTALMPISFAINATGNLSLDVATGRTGGNCAAAALGGGGISGIQITLFHNNDMSCAPITLMIGGTPYTINCTTPPPDGPCIDAATAITAANVSADSYTIHVKAKQGPKVCWTNDDSIVVPALGGTLTRTLNLAFVGGAGCT
jgi:hypothetical protein